MKTLKLSWLFVTFCILFSGTTFAQQIKIRGIVLDELDEPVVGASVIATPAYGTITDVNGSFELSVEKSIKSLEISYIGYQTQKVAVATNLKIKLKPDTQQLDEVLVVAYGTTKKSSFTGSASVVRSDEIKKFQGTGFTDALQGLTAGVNVSQDASNPGAEARISIRGIANMAGNTTPLYVVDGVPYDGSLNSINTNDIASLTVLKDAAAASLYGSRAANGVVIITTKTGKAGKVKVNFNASWGTSDNAVGYGKKADPKQTLLLYWEGLYNDKYYFEGGCSKQEAGDYASQSLLGKIFTAQGKDPTGKPIYVSPFNHIDEDWVLHDGNGNPYINPNLTYAWNENDWDWYGAYYKRKLRQNYSIDISGATENGKTNYFISTGFLDDKGYGGGDYYKRYSFSANVNSEINKWLAMGGSLRYAYSRQSSSGSTRALNYNMTLASPYLRNASNTDWVRSEMTGERVLQYGAYTSFFGVHPLSNRGDYWDNDNNDNFSNNDASNLNARYYAQISLPYNIKFKTTLNLDDNTSRSYTYDSAIWGSGQSEPWGNTIRPSGGSASRSNFHSMSVTNSNILSWNQSFDKHNISFLVGQEAYYQRTEYTAGGGSGIYQMNQFQVDSATKDYWSSSFSDRYALLSYISKLDYNYDDKYYLSGSFRRDGSSCFAPESRWGNFWSTGASWRISNEKFMEDFDWIDNLVIRGSYGTSGNDRLIPRQSNGKGGSRILYAYQGTYESNNLYNISGLKPASLATPKLHWEKNEQWNIGVDFALFSWLNGTLEYYTRSSDGLLYYQELPLSAQVGNVTGINTNVGDIRNCGFEATLGFQLFNQNKFQWRIDVNMSTLKNEVTKLPTEIGFWSNVVAWYKLEEGGSLYDFWAPRFAGVDPESGYATYYKKDGSVVNKTAALTKDDYEFVGSALPKVYGSLTNSFNFYGFDASFMLYYSLGGHMYCYNKSELASYSRVGVSPVLDLVKDRWSGPGDSSAKTPINFMTNRSISAIGYSDYYIINNDYLRLRNVTIGYTLPKYITKKIGLENARIYFSGDNLLTFGKATKYYTDPETGISGNTYNGNSDTEGYGGGRRVYMFGLNLTF